MTMTVKIDQATAAAAAGTSLFAVAEQLGVRVPTSCHGNGKCRECLVEVTHGMDRLTERTAAEAHLGASFRLACQARIANGEGKIRCHTLRRGAIRIVRSGADLPVLDGPPPLDPAVRRNGQAIWLDAQPIAQSVHDHLLIISGWQLEVGANFAYRHRMDMRTRIILSEQPRSDAR